ncbi:amyloid-beta precursor-like protein [Liolophura sinensis]|uniref:amyloid-beta precursor-like protein n=1 Tax=Liolophura sinensis TaxID=3198878 RepID=UPI0031585AB8
MGRYTVPLGLLVAVVSAQALAGSINVPEDSKFEPMVAFMCNKPAMRRTPEGWARDEKTDCLQDSVEILNYCKKMYPNHDVTNVVEANYVVTIEDWCSVGHKHCHSHGSHTVRPFRCLVGAFQSTALLVPEHCRFDHYHDTGLCERYDWWNSTSSDRCKKDDMICQSFDILLPCGVDRFSGVEFVCCPKDVQHKPKVSIDVHVDHVEKPAQENSSNDDEDDDDDEEDEDDDNDSEEEEAATAAPITPAPEVPEDGPYMKYIRNQEIEGAETEHERFTAAKKDWQKHHHEKITKMMKQWSAARQRIADLKDSDPKTAEKLNKEITERFQRMYHALEQEGNAEKQQLVTLHQQHVQKILNEKKRVAMQDYMDELQLDEPQTSRVLDGLQRYIKVEEKDRRHTLNHYQHVRDTNPMEAERIRELTIDHLDWIDKRINQSVKMLSRLPEIEEKVKPEIMKFLRTYQGINSDVAKSVLSPVTEDETKKAAPKFEADNIPKTPEPAHREETSQEEESKPAVEVNVEQVDPEPKTYTDKDTVVETEHQYFDVKPHFVAHKLDDKVSVQSSYRHVRESVSYGPSFGIAMGSVAVFVIIVVAVVMLRKRSHRQSVTHGFVEVDPAASPEERHVANMQMNGYENPTYRYFEMAH